MAWITTSRAIKAPFDVDGLAGGQVQSPLIDSFLWIMFQMGDTQLDLWLNRAHLVVLTARGRGKSGIGGDNQRVFSADRKP